MKINKKLLIPVFATAMGLSALGGIGGAVAWYQYNSKVTASYVGTSVADTGVLQIGWKDGNDIKWGRDFNEALSADSKLYPVTFGEITDHVPASGYMYPEAGKPDYADWATAQNGTHYYQFELYFRAYQTDATEAEGYKAVQRDVYLTDYVLKCLKPTDNSVDDSKLATKALRIHLDVAEQDNVLLSDGVQNTNLYGPLDLDKNGSPDGYHATAFNPLPQGKTEGQEIQYGVDGEHDHTADISAKQAVRAGDGTISDSEKVLFHTVADEDHPVKVIVTIWLEGWALINGAERAEWNPFEMAGTKVQVGLEFDTGIFRGSDLN